jgi:hypothetical protein
MYNTYMYHLLVVILAHWARSPHKLTSQYHKYHSIPYSIKYNRILVDLALLCQKPPYKHFTPQYNTVLYYIIQYYMIHYWSSQHCWARSCQQVSHPYTIIPYLCTMQLMSHLPILLLLSQVLPTPPTTIAYQIIQDHTIPYHALPYHPMPYRAIQYCTILHHIIPYPLYVYHTIL